MNKIVTALWMLMSRDNIYDHSNRLHEEVKSIVSIAVVDTKVFLVQIISCHFEKFDLDPKLFY
jgi:hypothetical protein